MKLLVEVAVASFLFFALCLYGISSAGAFHASFLALDNYVQTIAVSLRSPWLTLAMLVATYLGNWQTILAFSALVIMVLVLWRKHLSHERTDVILFLTSLFIGLGLAVLFKIMTGRVRPEGLFPQNGFLVSDSFPSAHALISTVVYGLIAHGFYHVFKKRWQKTVVITIGTFVVIAVGISRVYLGFHWFSDVLAGWFLGVVLLAFFIALFDRFEYTSDVHLTI